MSDVMLSNHFQFKTKTCQRTNSTWDKMIKLSKMRKETAQSRSKKRLTNRCFNVVKVLPLLIHWLFSGLLKSYPYNNSLFQKCLLVMSTSETIFLHVLLRPSRQVSRSRRGSKSPNLRLHSKSNWRLVPQPSTPPSDEKSFSF